MPRRTQEESTYRVFPAYKALLPLKGSPQVCQQIPRIAQSLCGTNQIRPQASPTQLVNAAQRLEGVGTGWKAANWYAGPNRVMAILVYRSYILRGPEQE